MARSWRVARMGAFVPRLSRQQNAEQVPQNEVTAKAIGAADSSEA